MRTHLGHAVVRPELLVVTECVLPETSDETGYDLRASKIWTATNSKETTEMTETYTIHVAENGYVIMRQSFNDGMVQDMQIAQVGELEEQLTVLRVKLKMLDAQTPAAAAPAPKTTSRIPPKTALPKAVVEALMNMNIKPEDLPVGILGSDMGKLTCMGHEVTPADLRAAWKP